MSVWNNLILLSFLIVYQLRVSCWYATIWLCWVGSLCVYQPAGVSCWYETIWFYWVLSVYISPVSAVGIKYLILLSFLIVYQPHVSCWYEAIWFCWVFSLCISPVSAIGMKLFDFAEFLCVYQPRVSCWYETIWLCWVSFLCVYLLFVWKLFDFVDFSLCISASCQLLVWNYLTVLNYRGVYQLRVSCLH